MRKQFRGFYKRNHSRIAMLVTNLCSPSRPHLRYAMNDGLGLGKYESLLRNACVYTITKDRGAVRLVIDGQHDIELSLAIDADNTASLYYKNDYRTSKSTTLLSQQDADWVRETLTHV